MNNLIKIITIFMAVAFVTLQSCEKEKFEKSSKQNVQISSESLKLTNSFTFYIDNEQVSEAEYNTLKEKSNDIFVIQSVLNNEEIIFAFTNEKAYVAYGDKNGINLKGMLQFTNHMSEYAKTSGTIAEYEKTGIIPESYTEYEKMYYDKIFGTPNNSKGFGKFCEDHNAGGDYFVFLNATTSPVLSQKWKNEISSVFNAFGVSVFVVTLYKKSFYRRKLITTEVSFLPGDRIVNFYGPNNNATKSFIVF